MKHFLPNSKWQEIEFWKPSVLALIAANVLPLAGVLFLGWSTFAIVVVYWAENVIIGMINVLKMLVCSPSQKALELAQATAEQRKGNSRQVQQLLEGQSHTLSAVHHGSKLFFIPFFVVHYGLFCMGHGVFIFELLGGGGHMSASPLDAWPFFWTRLREEGLLWAVGALAASHLFSFFTNFIYRGEYRQVTVPELMFRPYGRIVILHVAILIGAMFIEFLGSPVWMLVILIAGKTILDIGLHLAEREKNAAHVGDTRTNQAGPEFAK
jgi:hypothetical protein